MEIIKMYSAFRVGIGGPVGAGKTSLTTHLCRIFSKNISMAVITNDIYTKEDAEILIKKQVINTNRKNRKYGEFEFKERT